LGAHVLGANHSSNTTVYRSLKFGLIASVAFCGRGLCRSSLRDRPDPDVVVLPPPPPDTVVITRDGNPPPPAGTAATLCLAPGEGIAVLVTAAGDTLVGSARTLLSERRPAVDLAGAYAANRGWFEAGEPITVEQRSYSRFGASVRLDCGAIRRVGEHEGVPLFVAGTDDTPPRILYVPVRLGVWQPYSTRLG